MRLRPLFILLATSVVAQDSYPPATLPSFEGMDPEVVSHIEQHVKLVVRGGFHSKRYVVAVLAVVDARDAPASTCEVGAPKF